MPVGMEVDRKKMAKSSRALVIVESPAKARTISKFLGKGYIVESSIGHVRDLPESASDIPLAMKKEPWARLGIDIENDFRPLYIIPPKKRKQVSRLKELLKEVGMLYLATDEDREGESISWHLCEILKPRVPQRRLVFHEITREAIEKALKEPRDIDERLVKAQETRRILDRLYGYEVSPVLWRKIRPRLSAGRVQSIAVRMVVERERLRMKFVSAGYWDLQGTFATRKAPPQQFGADLMLLDGKRLASGKDFDDSGKLRAPQDVRRLEEADARRIAESLRGAEFKVIKVESRPYTDRPSPPFTTSTLQQEANRKLRFTARLTMQIAQRLYENGHITYMRTDSTALSDQAITGARSLIKKLYGPEYLSPEPRQYRTKVKNAQEAHEAIRPAGERFDLPEELKDLLSPDELRVYELIWKRTMACQMAEARGQRVLVQIEGRPSAGPAGKPALESAVFQATGKTIEFAGFLRANVEGADDPEAELADKEVLLPALEVGDPLDPAALEPKGHATQPPPRFTESSLIKELEANGVGRPSTYASIIDTILRRDYVVKQGGALVPTFVAFAVVGLLEKNFGRLVDTQFTADMEDDLDSISRGEKEPLPYLKAFYFGNKDLAGLKDLIKADIDARETCTLPLGKDEEGRAINIRVGKFGPYLERGEDRANIPDGTAPDALNLARAIEILSKDTGPMLLGRCLSGGIPGTLRPALASETTAGRSVYLKVGRYGPYVQLGENDDEDNKMKSLLPGMEPSTVTLETALKLLSLPRTLGVDPETGETVTADLGRYGQYVRRGKDAATLPPTDNALDVTLERAIQIIKEKPPGRRFGRGAPAVLKELGKSPQWEEGPIRILSGRFGPYVSDGKTNASLRRDQSPESLTIDEALDLLRARADRGPAKKPFRRGSAAKKKRKKKS
jgi:DNA topoisomerase I